MSKMGVVAFQAVDTLGLSNALDDSDNEGNERVLQHEVPRSL